jgi:hypothetical protein
MSKGSKEERAAEIQARSTVLAVIISSSFTLIATLITVFFAFPPFQEWAHTIVSSDQPVSLPIEKIPYTVYSFEGDDVPACCVGRAYLEFTNDTDLQPRYGLNYILPENDTREGYAGISFVFDKTQDLSGYQAIEFTIVFEEGLDQADISIEDITLEDVQYHITGNPGQRNFVVVPLMNFNGVELQAVRSIEFEVHSGYTSGNHWFDVRDIRLTR